MCLESCHLGNSRSYPAGDHYWLDQGCPFCAGCQCLWGLSDLESLASLLSFLSHFLHQHLLLHSAPGNLHCWQPRKTPPPTPLWIPGSYLLLSGCLKSLLCLFNSFGVITSLILWSHGGVCSQHSWDGGLNGHLSFLQTVREIGIKLKAVMRLMF